MSFIKVLDGSYINSNLISTVCITSECDIRAYFWNNGKAEEDYCTVSEHDSRHEAEMALTILMQRLS